MMAMGGKVNGGLYGTAPNLNTDPANPTLENSAGDVHFETDFRSVYAQVARQLAGHRLGQAARRQLPQERPQLHLNDDVTG